MERVIQQQPSTGPGSTIAGRVILTDCPRRGNPVTPADKTTPWQWWPAWGQYARLHQACTTAPAEDAEADDD